MKPTIYLITYYDFNHTNQRPSSAPIDPRFSKSDKNYVYYLIDEKVPDSLKGKKTILEKSLDPVLHAAGGKQLGEWSFLLAEEKHSFCEYPFFMLSSRFYQKNDWLFSSLDDEWDTLFNHLMKYGYGYLPSYDRPLRWISMDWHMHMRKKSWTYSFYPFTPPTFELVEKMFDVRMPQQYSHTADLFCNYIGFSSREHLLAYVNFYRPLLNYFLDESYAVKRDMSQYTRITGNFKNEKPLTFILEYLSHLFFFKEQKKYFCLHYDGYYEVDEKNKKKTRIVKYFISPLILAKRYLHWIRRRISTEGFGARARHFVLRQGRRLRDTLKAAPKKSI